MKLPETIDNRNSLKYKNVFFNSTNAIKIDSTMLFLILQMDIELSFTDKEGVQALMEGIIKYSWPEHLGELNIPFPRMSYDQAMEIYGSENPDLTIPYKV